jgi:hypothetical protein
VVYHHIPLAEIGGHFIPVADKRMKKEHIKDIAIVFQFKITLFVVF